MRIGDDIPRIEHRRRRDTYGLGARSRLPNRYESPSTRRRCRRARLRARAGARTVANRASVPSDSRPCTPHRASHIASVSTDTATHRSSPRGGIERVRCATLGPVARRSGCLARELRGDDRGAEARERHRVLPHLEPSALTGRVPAHERGDHRRGGGLRRHEVGYAKPSCTGSRSGQPIRWSMPAAAARLCPQVRYARYGPSEPNAGRVR